MTKIIVVIGSGLAGSLISNQLVKGCEVTLLERGQKDKIEYPSVVFAQKHFGAVKTFCIGQGGTTNLWDNGLIPIDSNDVSSQGFNDVLNEIKPYMDKAAEKLYFREKLYSTEYSTVRTEMNSISEIIGPFPDGVDCLYLS